MIRWPPRPMLAPNIQLFPLGVIMPKSKTTEQPKKGPSSKTETPGTLLFPGRGLVVQRSQSPNLKIASTRGRSHQHLVTFFFTH